MVNLGMFMGRDSVFDLDGWFLRCCIGLLVNPTGSSFYVTLCSDIVTSWSSCFSLNFGCHPALKLNDFVSMECSLTNY